MLALGGCVTRETTIETEEQIRQVQANQSVVFGRIEWLEDGEKKKIGSGVFTMSLEPQLVRLEDRARINGEVNEGGRFAWPLEPGTYLMNKIAYRDPWSGNYFVTPKVAFAVLENGKTYYIGVLECDFERKRDFIGGLSGSVTCRTLDQSDQDYEYVEKKFAITGEDIEKSVMIHDTRLPGTVDTTAEFNLAMSIVNAILYGASQ
ncbi:MAG: hypothetical protein JSV45_04555 [Chromatiales bacterium]|nr:MAG: hypothetical protein JSV45_04555 [Chromatiales bacterium]